MLEVRSGVLLGSMGDALAAITRVASITKVYSITHILTIANQPLDWSIVQSEKQPPELSGNQEEAAGGNGKKEVDCEGSEGGEMGKLENEGVRDAEVEVGGVRREARCGFKTMFVCLPDMPSSDLLHHFPACCQFIREAVDQKGTVLVHCEYGVSRSVTVVLAYLMWCEGRPFQLLYDKLKEKKPEIRPNPGFVEQLKLWGSMRCKIDLNNKSYRAYRLQHMAKDMIGMNIVSFPDPTLKEGEGLVYIERFLGLDDISFLNSCTPIRFMPCDSGYIENLHSSVDPSTNVLESNAYFRCRKCRRLLFTEESVLQHELGRGQLAFKWHKRSKPTAAAAPSAATSTSTDDSHPEQPASPKKDREAVKDGSMDSGSKDEAGPQASSESDKGEKIDSVPDQPPVPVTPTELAELRAHLATVVAMDSTSGSASPKCSSYFIEPVEWMETLLLGHVEGKILCPKCKARIGSFNWAGEQCSCGQWVVPSFQIHRSKIDETRTLTKRKPVVK